MGKQKSHESFLRNFSIGQLEMLHGYYHWARDRVLRTQGLRHVHLTMIRLIRLRGSLTLKELRTVTGYKRSSMNKHRDFLVERKLIRELPKKGDGRLIHLGCTDKGKRTLENIDEAIEAEFMKVVGFSHRSQLKSFSKELEKALLEFPYEKVIAARCYSVVEDRKSLQARHSLSSLYFVTPTERDSLFVKERSADHSRSESDDDALPY